MKIEQVNSAKPALSGATSSLLSPLHCSIQEQVTLVIKAAGSCQSGEEPEQKKQEIIRNPVFAYSRICFAFLTNQSIIHHPSQSEDVRFFIHFAFNPDAFAYPISMSSFLANVGPY